MQYRTLGRTGLQVSVVSLERVKEDTEIAEGPVLSQDALIKLEAMLR